MTALQYRDEKGALTHEVQAGTWSPKRLRIESAVRTSPCGSRMTTVYFEWLADHRGSN